MTNITNTTSSGQTLHALAAFFLAVGVLCIIVTILAGNLLVLYVFFKERLLRRRVQYRFIASMAVADLLVGLLIIPTTLLYKLLGFWPLGDVVCDLWLSADVMLCTASMQHICVIGIDRYLALTVPIGYGQKRGPRTVYLLIGATWFASTMVAFPPLIGWHIDQNPGKCELTTNTAYIIYSASGSFFIPLVVICLVYKGIFRIAKTRQRQNRESLLVKKRIIENSVAVSTNAPDINVKIVVKKPIIKDFDWLSGDFKNDCQKIISTTIHRRSKHGHPEEKRRESCPAIICASERDTSDDQLTPLVYMPAKNGCLPRLVTERDRRKSWSPAKITDSLRRESILNKVVSKREKPPSAKRQLLAVSANLGVPASAVLSPTPAKVKTRPWNQNGGTCSVSLLQPPVPEPRLGSILDGNDSSSIAQSDRPSVTPLTTTRYVTGKTSVTSLRSNSSTDTHFAAELVQARIDHVRKREKQSAVLLGTILTAFVICWCPFFVIYLMRGICCEAPSAIFDVFFFLGYCNSGLNPLLYGLFNTDFRKAFRKAYHASRAYHFCSKPEVSCKPSLIASVSAGAEKSWFVTFKGRNRLIRTEANKASYLNKVREQPFTDVLL